MVEGGCHDALMKYGDKEIINYMTVHFYIDIKPSLVYSHHYSFL